MENRDKLHELLCSIMGSRNVYFSPPENLKLVYPCIVYSLSKMDPLKADDINYLDKTSYTVTLIDKDPLSKFCKPIINIPYASFSTGFTKDNLNHFVFNIYH